MAFSKSTNINMAQQPKETCNVCQDDLEISWNCVECKITICLTCGEKHILDRKHQHHRVKNTKDGIPILKPIKCGLNGHTVNNISIFCQECEVFLCAKCLVENRHKTHHLKELGQVYIEHALKLEEYEEILIGLSEQFFGEEIDKIRKMKELHRENYENQKLKVNENDRLLKEIITTQTNKLLADLESNWQNTQSEILILTGELQQKIQEIKNRLSTTKKKMKVNDIDNIFKLSKEVKDFVKNIDTSFTPLPVSSKKFEQDTPLLKHNITEFFGTLNATCLTSPDLIHFKVVQTYITDLPYISLMSLNNSDGNIWIGYLREIRRIKLLNNQSLTIHKKTNIKLNDITCTSNGDLLMAIENPPSLKLLTNEYEIKELYEFTPKGWFSKPQVPISLHVQHDQTILVGTVEPGGDLYHLSESSHRQVVVLSRDYKMLKTFEYDHEGNRLFTYPRRLLSNIDNDIYVLDSLSSKEGRLVTLHKTGAIEWIYSGNHGKFKPWDIVTTPIHNIILCNRNDSSLHILTFDGHVIKYLKIEDLGIFQPSSMDIDQYGKLYIGCWQTNAKLHVLSLSAC